MNLTRLVGTFLKFKTVWIDLEKSEWGERSSETEPVRRILRDHEEQVQQTAAAA